MANDCVMLEGFGVGGGEEGENAGVELSLELSIGGGYAKYMKGGVDLEENGRRSSGGSGEFCTLVDPQAKRETQESRRQEPRKKMEGKLKRMHGNGNGCVKYDKDESRVRARDNGDGLIEPASKREKIRDGTTGDNQGSIPVVPVQFKNGWMSVVGGNEVKDEKCGFQPMGCRSSRLYQGNRIMEQNCGKEGRPASGSISPGQSPSDYENTNMLLGYNASDNGSNSSHFQRKIQQQKNIPAPTDPPQQSEHSNSSKQTESNHAAHSSVDSSVKPSEKTKTDTGFSQSVNNNVPTSPQTENNPDPTILPHIPCVSTTGNGPDGRTVMGFLYRYNKDEVSIMCVCHGSSYSSVEFVRHAGGIDVTYLTRHITVIPSSAFGV